MLRRFAVTASMLASLLCALVLSGCGSNVAGTYELDKTAIREAAQADLKAKGQENDPMAGMALGMIEAMSMTLILNDDGTASMNMNMMGQTQAATGTWSLSGKTLNLTMAAPGETPETATGTVDGDTITLKPPSEDQMPFDLVFKKKQA